MRAPKANVLLVGTFIDKLSDNTDFKAEMRKKSEIILETCARLMNGPKIVDFIGVIKKLYLVIFSAKFNISSGFGPKHVKFQCCKIRHLRTLLAIFKEQKSSFELQ